MKKLLYFFIRPAKWFVAVIWTATLISLCIFFNFAVRGTVSAVAMVFYVVTPVLIAYTVYTAVKYAPAINKFVVGLMCRNKWTGRFATDYGFRASVLGSVTSFINIVYALYTMVVAVITLSVWYGLMSAAYFILSAMRFYAVDSNRRQLSADEVNYQGRWTTYRNVGIALIMYASAFSAVVAQMVVFQHHNEYAGYLIYAVAGYTVYKIIVAITNVIRVRKYNNPTWQALRNIIFADSLISLLSLQNSMFAAFAGGFDYRFLNAVSGILVCLIIAMIGMYMVISGSYRRRKIDADKSAPVKKDCAGEADIHNIEVTEKNNDKN